MDWWLVLALAIVAFLAFARTIPYEFVYDDEFQILRNPWIRSWSNLGQIFTSSVWEFRHFKGASNYYRPFHILIYVLAYSLSGLKPHAYHLLSILLHCLCTILVAQIGLKLTRDKYVSIAGALIFALHPIHAESVAWIAGVTDPLCAMFYFGALYFYLKDSQDEKRRVYWILVVVFYFGALLSKEMAFTFPVIAAWMDWVLFRKLRWSRYAGFAGIFAIYSWLRIDALGKFQIEQLPLPLDPLSRILSTITLFTRYLIKLFVPNDISAFHVFTPTTRIFSAEFASSLVVLVFSGIAIWLLRRQRVALFLIGFFHLTLLPVLNISGIGQNVFADRYLYIPTLGSSLVLPLVAQAIWKAHPSGWKFTGLQLGGAMLGFLLTGYALLLWSTTLMWRDAPTLYTETMKLSPTAMLIANSLAGFYFDHGEYEKSEEWYKKALNLWGKSFIKAEGNLAAAYAGLGGIYFHQQKLNLASDYFMKAYKADPTSTVNLQSLAMAYTAQKDYKRAAEFLQRVADLNPRDETVYNNLSWLYFRMDKYDKALKNARKALEIDPNFGNAHINMARAYVGMGMKDEARRSYEAARKVDPSRTGLVEKELKILEGTAR